MNINEIRKLLSLLQTLLRKQGETNWIRGIMAAIEALDAPNGTEQARSIYMSMNQGVGSFSDYNIWFEDFDARLKENEELDGLRERLWQEFDL